MFFSQTSGRSWVGAREPAWVEIPTRCVVLPLCKKFLGSHIYLKADTRPASELKSELAKMTYSSKEFGDVIGAREYKSLEFF